MTSTVYPIKCRIRNDGGTVTRVDVYDDIGPGGWFSDGLTAKDFAAQLADVKGALEVHINSAGGDVFDGIAIANGIRDYKGDVTTVVDGLAASIASVISQAGGKRIVQAGSMVMIHDAFGLAIGNAAEMTKMAQTLDQVSDNIADIYAARTGRGSTATWRDRMRDETWYTADEAVAAGLADEVGNDAAVLPAGLDLDAFTAIPGRIAARLRALPQALTPHAGQVQMPAPQVGWISNGGMRGAAGLTPLKAATADGRVLGIESMPLPVNKAITVHHTATTDEEWDGPAAVAAMPAEYATLHYCHAWQSADADDSPHVAGDDDADDKKASYKFPHHKTKGGPANLAACRNGLARLSGADIPDADRAGVKAHLQAHLDDASGGSQDDHAHHPVKSGFDPEQFTKLLKEGIGE